MTKPKRNRWRLILSIIATIISLIFLIAGGAFVYFIISFGTRKDVIYKDCGNQTYELFRDFEGARIMHNTNNEKMNEAGNDIITKHEALDITTTLGIDNEQEKEYILFIPENNKLEDGELNNLIECYPDSEMILRTNIRDVEVKPRVYEKRFDEEKLR